MSPLALLAGLLAAPVVAGPAGDGGTTRLTVNNASVHTLALAAGATGSALPSLGVIPGYQSRTVLAQCLAGQRSSRPALSLSVDRELLPVEVPELQPEVTPPALFLGVEPAGAAFIGETLRSVGVDRLVRVPLAEMPGAFGALRAAPFIIASGDDLAALKPGPRLALEQAVASGTTLVVAIGEAGPEEASLSKWTGVAFGAAEHPGPAARSVLPRAVTIRRLVPGASVGVRALVMADDSPLLTETSWGLGRVRAFGVPFGELERGPLLEAAFTRVDDPTAPIRAWLNARVSLNDAADLPLGGSVWGCLGALLALALLSRAAPRVAAAGTVPLVLAAIVLPPGGQAVVAPFGEAVALAYPGGAVTFGAVDLTFGRGGAHSLDAGSEPLSLLRTWPAGACLFQSDDASIIALRSEPGGRARLEFLAVSGPLDWTPGEPDGALAGRTLERLPGKAPFPRLGSLSPQSTHLWRLHEVALTEAQPLVIPAPGTEAP